jgi:FSR family fosmidomycin resistance protein-like MFS transporter
MEKQLRFLNGIHIFNDGFNASLLLLLPFIAKDLHISLTQVGFLGGLVGVCAIFLALPAGTVSARYGGVRTLLFAMGVYALGFLVTGFAPSFSVLVLTFFIASLGMGIFHPIAFGLVSKWSTKETRGRAMGNFTAIGDIGRVGLSAGVTFLITGIGWRFTAEIYGLVALGAFIFLYFFYRNKNEMIHIAKKSSKADFGLLFKNKRLMLASFAGAIDTFASASLFVFLPFLLLAKHIEPAILGTLTAAFFIGNFVGKAGLGRVVDKIGNIKVFIVADILMAVFIVVLTAVNSVFVIAVVAVILGALTKGTVPVAATLISDAIEGDNHEHGFGVASFIDNIAAASSPIILGFVSDKYGVSQAFTISALVALIAVIPVFLYASTKKS